MQTSIAIKRPALLLSMLQELKHMTKWIWGKLTFTAQPFHYLGKTFTPHSTAPFSEILRGARFERIDLAGLDSSTFYDLALRHRANQYNSFKVDGQTVVMCGHFLIAIKAN